MFNSSSSSLLPIGPYLLDLCAVTAKLRGYLFIHSCTITSPQLLRIISSAKHCTEISFERCKILIPNEIDFCNSLDGATFKNLRFDSLDHSNKDAEDDYDSVYFWMSLNPDGPEAVKVRTSVVTVKYYKA